jgi:small subunit ribosomal protein S6
MAKKQNSTNQYEAMFLLGPIAQAEPETALGLCRKVIESHGGAIIVLKKWDERKLCFEVGGQKRGTYIISYFRAPGGALVAMERDVKLSEEILRAIFLKADHMSEKEMNAVEPQPIQIREERPMSYESYDRPPRPFRRREETADMGIGGRE